MLTNCESNLLLGVLFFSPSTSCRTRGSKHSSFSLQGLFLESWQVCLWQVQPVDEGSGQGWPNQEKAVGTGNDMSSVSWNADASWTESTLLRYTHYTHQVHDKWGAATLKMGMNPIEKQSEALLQAAVGSNAKRTIYQLAGLHTLLVHLLLQWKKPRSQAFFNPVH